MKWITLGIAGLIFILSLLNCEGIGDTTPPIVTILSPYESSSISEDTVKIEVSATDEESKIKEVKFYIDSKFLDTDSTGDDNIYSVIWVTTYFESGSHKIIAEAEDEAGNIGGDTIGITLTHPALARL